MIEAIEFREKYGMFDTIEENYQFIASNPQEQRGRNSIQWIAPYMDVLRRYAEGCSHITEFGVNQVNSTYAFLAAKPKKVVSVDLSLHKNATKHLGAFNGVNFWLKWAERLADEEGILFTPIEGDSSLIDIEPTELLFIDSKHTKEHLTKELKKHKDKVSKYIIFHDTTLFKAQLTPPIEELLKEGDFGVIEHIEKSPGLMVIKRKSI